MVLMSNISSIGTTNYLPSLAKGQVSSISGEGSKVISSTSTKVTLSQDAKALANFSNNGISVSLRQMSKPLTSQSQSENSNNINGAVEYKKSISKDDLDKLLLNFGATNEEKNQIHSGLDVNQDGSISHDELLKGISSTLGAGNPLGQTILSIMDRNGDSNGLVNSIEFARITTAFNDEEK